jgi:hypothetical protein
VRGAADDLVMTFLKSPMALAALRTRVCFDVCVQQSNARNRCYVLFKRCIASFVQYRCGQAHV